MHILHLDVAYNIKMALLACRLLRPQLPTWVIDAADVHDGLGHLKSIGVNKALWTQLGLHFDLLHGLIISELVVTLYPSLFDLKVASHILVLLLLRHQELFWCLSHIRDHFPLHHWLILVAITEIIASHFFLFVRVV